MAPLISIVGALASKNHVIGRENKLPWHIPSDLKRFKELTQGHPIIMGRKTYQSIGKALPNRTNIIITHDILFSASECIIVHSLSEAIEQAKKTELKEIFIIGGGEIFTQAIQIADRLYLTLVDGDIEGDSIFPDYSAFTKELTHEEKQENGFTFRFITLMK